MNYILCLTEKSVKKYINSEFMVFTDISKFRNGKNIIFFDKYSIELNKKLEKDAIKSYKNFFEQFNHPLNGFINNHYECSFYSYYSFFKFIESKLGQNDKLFLPKIYKGFHSIQYYFGEHETNNSITFNRDLMFGSNFYTLFGSRLNIKLTQEPKFALFVKLKLYFARKSVFFLKLLFDLFFVLNQKKSNTKDDKGNNIFNAIQRNNSQNSFIFSLTNHLDVNIFRYKFVFDLNRMAKIFALYFKNYNLKKYKYNYSFDGINFDFSQSFQEIFSLVPNILVYQNSLENKFNGLLSIEHKSPHAYIDAYLNKLYGFPDIGFQSVNQNKNAIPIPFFSKNVITKANFQKDIDTFSRNNNFVYLGELSSSPGKELTWSVKSILFLGQPDDESLIEYLSSKLSVFSEKAGLSLSFRKHPRQRQLSKVKIRKDSSSSFVESIANYDLFITFPSAVVDEIINHQKPILLLNFGKWFTENSQNISKKFPSVDSPEDLIFALNDIPKIISQCNAVYSSHNIKIFSSVAFTRLYKSI